MAFVGDDKIYRMHDSEKTEGKFPISPLWFHMVHLFWKFHIFCYGPASLLRSFLPTV